MFGFRLNGLGRAQHPSLYVIDLSELIRVIKMTILKDKIVTIKKSRQCFGCLRKFPIGHKMHSIAGKDSDFWYVHECRTCYMIIPYLECDSDGYEEGCVIEECLERGLKTPEQLLNIITQIPLDI